MLNSLDTLTDEELMLQESGVLIGLIQQTKLTVRLVRRFANEVVAPKVREMDENEMMEPEIIKNLFEQGVRTTFNFYCAPLDLNSLQLMSIETPADYGGAESSFTSAIIAIEELAKIDPSVSVLCDVHNTLVNTIFRTYGTEEQKEKFLPMLSTSSVFFTLLRY